MTKLWSSAVSRPKSISSWAAWFRRRFSRISTSRHARASSGLCDRKECSLQQQM